MAQSDLQFRPPRLPLVSPGAIEHHVADMTVTVSADVTLAALQKKLAQANQWLPIDGDVDTTVGALVENNSTGPLRLGYGAWRDLLLGCQFRNGRDELITAGGRTMKNVAGYDLTKFMVGQRGVFGRIVTITTRTYRRPSDALHVSFPADATKLNTLLPTSARPQWALLTRDRLLCGYVGDARTIDFYQSAVAPHQPENISRGSLQADIDLRGRLWKVNHNSVRASVPPTRIREFADRARLQSWIADAAFGIVIGEAIDASAETIRQAASEINGTVTFPGSYHCRPGEYAILQRLKRAFDPDNRLEPLKIHTE